MGLLKEIIIFVKIFVDVTIDGHNHEFYWRNIVSKMNFSSVGQCSNELDFIKVFSRRVSSAGPAKCFELFSMSNHAYCHS